MHVAIQSSLYSTSNRCLSVIHFRREIFVKYGKKMTKYEITYQTTVRELKEMVAEELGMEAKMILNYDTKILDDDVVLMKQDELRLDTYPLLVLSEIGKKLYNDG